MNTKDLKNLKPGDKIKWKRGYMNAGLHETVVKVIPADPNRPLTSLTMIEINKWNGYNEKWDGINNMIVPHNRFTKD